MIQYKDILDFSEKLRVFNFDSQSSMPTEIFGESSFETAWSGTSERQDTFLEKMVSNITFPLAVPSMENRYNTLFNDPDFDT